MSITPAVYIVTDIEADGGTPGVHSMIAFASVAVSADGTIQGEFEAVLAPLEGGITDPNTMKWWETQPEAWAAATHDPQPPAAVMQRFVDWVKQYPHAIFAAHPLNFDGMWMNFYLRRYTSYAVTQGLHDTDRLFSPFGLCLRSFGAALIGKSIEECGPDAYPPDWLGNHAHTHRAIDDARGYASLLVTLFALSRAAQRK
jgi:DNA polymerase III alpha subunit (gram-positive type)